MFGLIDANSFYCSCERAFEPKLRGRALVVLSNNDGCVIARTNEAKDAGLKMGDAWHLVKDRPGVKGVVDWRSSNYALYGDMSRRFFEVLTPWVPAVEPYSIDEMFLDLARLPVDLARLAAEIRADVLRQTKIPCCVGIGPTKTIAKLANKVAKGDRTGPGVIDFATAEARARAYPTIGLDDLWGMGRASVAKLGRIGVSSVADFVAMPAVQVRKLLTVTGQRTHAELQGIVCAPLDLELRERKSLASTRSFGRSITSWPEMREAVATYTARAAEKARKHGLAAAALQVFMHTNQHNGDRPHYPSETFKVEPTADTLALIGAATRSAQRMWREGYRYAKARVIFVDLAPIATLSAQLFITRDPVKSAKLMGALEGLNARYGRGTLRPAATEPEAPWGMRRGRLSPRYTTHLGEMMDAQS